MQVRPDAAPDSLLAQLEFLAWLGHCIQSGNPDPDSLRKASADFIGRHVAHWIPQAAALLGEDAEPYRLVFRMLVNWLATIQETD
jgi:nitrate reductase assembly molybdenum cofactor insertion protein NarJ